jgi:diacylglycerol O-acyltransferase
VNDLVLGVVAGAFRELLLARGETPVPGAVRCLVPVSVRSTDARGVFDNRVSALIAALPVEVEDPQERVVEAAVRMRALKATHEAQAGQWITTIADATPPPALTAGLHLAFRSPHRNLTTVVTNVPGPTGHLQLAGRPMQVAYPYVPIADRLRVGVAVTTYDDRLLLGVTFDRDSTPTVDADVFVRALESGFSALAKVAATTTTLKETTR